jgi:hypothetical protein
LLFLVDKAGRQGTVLKRTANNLYFLLTELTSAKATEYSVLLHSLFLLSCLFVLDERCTVLRRTYLAASLERTLISIRAGLIGAERKSNKAAINKVGFCRRQLTGAAADQYSVLVIHTFLLSSFGPV